MTAIPYEQAIDAYFAEALARGEDITIDSPNRNQSQYRRGIWHLHNFEGALIARVGRDFVHISSTTLAPADIGGLRAARNNLIVK